VKAMESQSRKVTKPLVSTTTLLLEKSPMTRLS